MSAAMLSNICLACMPVLRGTQVAQHDRRLPRHDDDHDQMQPLHASAPTTTRRRRRWRSRRISSTSSARSGTSPTPTTPGASRPATPMPTQIKKAGGEVVGTTGIPIGTADMTPFLSKITGDFDGLFVIFFGKDGITIGNQAYDLGLHQEVQMGRRRRGRRVDQPAGARQQDRRVCRHQPLCPGARSAAQHALPQGVLRRGGRSG